MNLDPATLADAWHIYLKGDLLLTPRGRIAWFATYHAAAQKRREWR